MKRICLLFCFLFFVLHFAFGQGGTWTWISGDSAANSPGTFGTQGVPSVNNHPPGLYEPAEWKDKQGNFWLYGGWRILPNGSWSDLWKYNPATNEWTWINGNGLANQTSVYGIQNTGNPSNTPGRRSGAAVTFVDTSGNLWLFGGDYSKNDLWKFDIGANEWTWVNGPDTINVIGVHGTQGIPSASNIPGSRNETCSGWTDASNNLWLFGGYGADDNGNVAALNDLMKYDIATGEWTWMSGSAFISAPPNYGVKGVAAAGNVPGARLTYTKWKDVQGNFWLMGGSTVDTLINYNYFYGNDVWKYDLGANEWTWMSGSNVRNDSGHYHATCAFDTINLPASRIEQRSSVTDNCGRFFWLFGGNTWTYGVVSDLWVFDPQKLEWTLVNGNNIGAQAGNFGNLGVPSSSNMPAARWGAVAWWGVDNKFYLFGGQGASLSYYYSDLWVFNPDTNCVSTSCSALALPPAANFQADKTTICANDCVNFTNTSANATSWQWSFAGGSPSTSANQSPRVCYLDSGIYNVTLVASNSAASDTLDINNYITVIAPPPTPSIQDHQGTAKDTLTFNSNPSYISYQWYKDSALINGATDTILVAYQNGNYNVEVTGTNGCKIAVGINVVLGLQNYMTDHVISLWPNPAGDKLIIDNGQLIIKSIDIYNVLGEKVQSEQETINKQLETVINVSALPSGVYFVQVSDETQRVVLKFVKE